MYNEIKLSDDRIFKFKYDVTVEEMKNAGKQPTSDDPNEIQEYNEKLLCVFSHDPILTQDLIKKLPTQDYQKLMIMVLEDYQQRTLQNQKDFRDALKVKKPLPKVK